MKLKAGEWVEVRERGEILATLDERGRLEGLPFMPQMFDYCGQRLRVYKRAHKTCDTVNNTGGRRMGDAVHLDGVRCNGESHGGCQALCLIFWKEAWLKRVSTEQVAPNRPRPDLVAAGQVTGEAKRAEDCVWAGTLAEGTQPPDDPTYVCQATELPRATQPLPWWDIRQYAEDVSSRNIGFGRLLRGMLFAATQNVIDAGVGLGPTVRWIYDRFQALWGGVPYPGKRGRIRCGDRTPASCLNLQPGDCVRVKDHSEILRTLDTRNRNQGLYFDAEEVPYCGGTFVVRKRVRQIINEKTGKMMRFKNESIILEGVCCEARYSSKRFFCPRSIYPLWREVWLEKVSASELASPHGGARPEQ